MAQNTHNQEKDQDQEKRRGWLQLALVILFVGGAFLLSLYLSSLQDAPTPNPSQQDLRLLVETASVTPQSYRLRFETTGTVQVRAMTNIVPQVSGRIVHIDENAFAGGMFDPGMVLFEIEKQDFELAVEQMEAEIARAQTALDIQEANSQIAVAEWREFNPDTPAPPLVAQQPQLKEARANLGAAQSQLKQARLNLLRTDYRLPFAGRITEFQLELGQYVVTGQSYGQAYRLESLEIDVPLEPQKLQWLLEAQDPVITITSDFLGAETYRAYVKRVAGKLEPQTRFARAVLGLKEQNTGLVPDVFVHVNVIGPEREQVWVLPPDALQQNGRIWVVTPEKKLGLLQPKIIQITRQSVVAESDGSTIQVVRGNLPEATVNTPVRLAGKDRQGSTVYGRSD